MTDTALRALATYGTLAPGRVNAHQLDGLTGRWLTGTVRGTLFDAGWGAAEGYPGLVLDAQDEAVDVYLFVSDDLPAHWARLDAFEGPGYTRTPTLVQTDTGDIPAQIYALTRSPR